MSEDLTVKDGKAFELEELDNLVKSIKPIVPDLIENNDFLSGYKAIRNMIIHAANHSSNKQLFESSSQGLLNSSTSLKQ